MNKYLEILEKNILFKNVDKKQILVMLGCLEAEKKEYKKGQYIFYEGDEIDKIMILVKGSLLIQKDDYWGNRTIINIIKPGDLFLEAYLAEERIPVLNDIIASVDSEVIYFNVNKIISTCSNACIFHKAIINNFFYAISNKNRKLITRLHHISKRTTRDKLISYLSDEAIKQNSNTIEIPFKRQELADFLALNRSNMTRELSKLKNEGLIDFYKNKFILKK